MLNEKRLEKAWNLAWKLLNKQALYLNIMIMLPFSIIIGVVLLVLSELYWQTLLVLVLFVPISLFDLNFKSSYAKILKQVEYLTKYTNKYYIGRNK